MHILTSDGQDISDGVVSLMAERDALHELVVELNAVALEFAGRLQRTMAAGGAAPGGGSVIAAIDRSRIYELRDRADSATEAAARVAEVTAAMKPVEHIETTTVIRDSTGLIERLVRSVVPKES